MNYLHQPYQYVAHPGIPMDQPMSFDPTMGHPAMMHPMDGGYLYQHPPFDMVDFYPIMDYEEYAENLSRPRLTKEQVETLEAQFQAHPKPSSNVKRQLAAQTNLSLPRVAVSNSPLPLFSHPISCHGSAQLTIPPTELVPKQTGQSEAAEASGRIRAHAEGESGGRGSRPGQIRERTQRGIHLGLQTFHRQQDRQGHAPANFQHGHDGGPIQDRGVCIVQSIQAQENTQ
jgi:hypothetical protein